MTKSKKLFKKRTNVGKPKPIVVCEPHGVEVMNEPVEVSSNNEVLQCSSEKKLNVNIYNTFENNCDSNEIINLSVLQEAIQKFVVCKSCSGIVSLSSKRGVGLACEMVLHCSVCEEKLEFSNSKKHHYSTENKKLSYDEINLRLVYGLRSIGKGGRAGEKLCGALNLPKPPSKFQRYVSILGSAVEDVCKDSMKSAMEEAVAQNNNDRDLTVALDGSWHRRGHVSLHGVVTCTSVDTGKVIDVDILSKHCTCKDKLKGQHEEACTANYKGTSGGMEVSGVVNIFNRSISQYNVRYTNYLGDGDCKGHKAVLQAAPYGDKTVSKLECLGHVQKRMGTRLKNLKTKLQGKKLEDGKVFGGRGRVTDSAIADIQKYYGLAIRRNSNNLQGMRESVWAEYFHLLSSDENPQHGLCPKGSESWCKYQRAKSKGECYKHADHFHLPRVVVEEMKPIFRDLSEPELLKKCLHGMTQNPNESVNSVIWNRLPKTTFVGFRTLHFGVWDAVASFNDGNMVVCHVYERLGFPPGKNCVEAMKRLDSYRIDEAKRVVKNIEMKARQKRNAAKRKLEDLYEQQEDPDEPSYGAGMY